jgi:aryl-alcohol dehydrogenase-like predicted oxidoreductase
LPKTLHARSKLVLATKVAGPSRGMPWVREGSGMTAKDIVASCDASLKRLQTDVIDLYQIHWPERHVPAFGALYYNPEQERSARPIREQLEALGGLVKAGKVRPSACPTKRLMACTSSCAWPSSTACRVWQPCRTRIA